jgi:trimethylamine--corrinoid protein Co-methyltransferase
MLGALAGADIFGHLGICGTDQGSSLDMLVMQHELVGYVERVMRGVRFDDDLLGMEAIAEVGPGGTFMDHDFTATNFRKELWFPQLLDRSFYDEWARRGKRTLADVCREKKEQLLREHEPEPLPDDVERELGRVLASARL